MKGRFLYVFLIVLVTTSTMYHCRIDPEKRIVAIQPLGKCNSEFADTIRQAITKYYGFKTIVYEKMDMPASFYTNVKSPRYRADSIIQHFKKHKPDSVSNVIAYTSHDISCTKKDASGNIKSPVSRYSDWGVFGLGYRPGPSCVVSDFRIVGKNKSLTIDRLKKISLHEIGHNLGLPHCPDPHCFMRDAAESIKTIDAVELNLCSRCKSNI